MKKSYLIVIALVAIASTTATAIMQVPGNISLVDDGTIAEGTGAGYEYLVQDEDGHYLVSSYALRDETNKSLTAQYKTENDNRITRWESSAPSLSLDEYYVAVTFTEPLTPVLALQVLADTELDDQDYVLVGHDSNNERITSRAFHGIDVGAVEDRLANPEQNFICTFDPQDEDCVVFTWTGIMEVGGYIPKGALVTSLGQMRDDARVHLADSTGVEITQQHLVEHLSEPLDYREDVEYALEMMLWADELETAWP